MRLGLFVFILLFSGQSLHLKAQIGHKSIYLNGNLSFYKISSLDASNYSRITTHGFSVIPVVGTMVNRNILMGLGIGYLQEKNNGISSTILPGAGQTSYVDYETLTRNVSALVFLKYLRPVSNQLYLSGRIVYSYGFQHAAITQYGSSTQDYHFTEVFNGTKVSYLKLSPEIMYFLTKKLGVEVDFGGLNLSWASQNVFGFTDGQFEYSLSLNPSQWEFGIFFILGGKQKETAN
jgi:hypothetical protein